MKATVSSVILSLALSVGCQKSVEQKSEELADTRQQAAENADQARREASDKAAKAYNEADETVQKEQQKVNEKAADVARTADSVRDNFRKEAEEELGKVDKRIIDLNTKLATAKKTKAPRAELEASLKGLQTKSQSLHQNVANIQNTTEAAITTVKSDFEAQISQIEKSLDELERQV
jgi:chromosome segregation ATPase